MKPWSSLLLFASVLAVACGSGGGGLKPTEFESVILQASESGGQDDGQGRAVAWAVDPDNGLTAVIAMRYPTGESEIVQEVDIPSEEVAAAYLATVPTELVADADAWPILGALLTDSAGVDAVPGGSFVVLASGDPLVRLPDSVYVATNGKLTLSRPDGPEDELDMVLTLQEVSRLGPGATVVDATVAVKLNAQLSFPSAFTD